MMTHSQPRYHSVTIGAKGEEERGEEQPQEQFQRRHYLEQPQDKEPCPRCGGKVYQGWAGEDKCCLQCGYIQYLSPPILIQDAVKSAQESFLLVHEAYQDAITKRRMAITQLHESGISQSELARKMGLSRQAVSMLIKSTLRNQARSGKAATSLT